MGSRGVPPAWTGMVTLCVPGGARMAGRPVKIAPPHALLLGLLLRIHQKLPSRLPSLHQLKSDDAQRLAATPASSLFATRAGSSTGARRWTLGMDGSGVLPGLMPGGMLSAIWQAGARTAQAVWDNQSLLPQQPKYQDSQRSLTMLNRKNSRKESEFGKVRIAIV